MYTVNIQKVPAQIRALRVQQGLSQEKLVKKSGTNQPTISRLERAQMVPQNLEVLASITEALNAQILVDVVPKKVNLERVHPVRIHKTTKRMAASQPNSVDIEF